jgi:predicted DNA-binding protein YlxM (UPF0122 family)
MPLHKTGSGRTLDNRTAVIGLFDAYAGMLTARQRRLVRLYYHEDLSFGEIASRLGVSRQAVYDGLRRSVREMRHLEARLRMLAPRPGANGDAARNGAAGRLVAVERAAARLTAAGAATGSLLRALRALREVL